MRRLPPSRVRSANARKAAQASHFLADFGECFYEIELKRVGLAIRHYSAKTHSVALRYRISISEALNPCPSTSGDEYIIICGIGSRVRLAITESIDFISDAGLHGCYLVDRTERLIPYRCDQSLQDGASSAFRRRLDLWSLTILTALAIRHFQHNPLTICLTNFFSCTSPYMSTYRIPGWMKA